MVAWDEPIRSNGSEEFEAATGGPKAGCDPLTSSTAGWEALPKSSPLEGTGADGAWLKALQSPKSPFPLVAVKTGRTIKVRNFLKCPTIIVYELKLIRVDRSPF